MAYHEHKVSEFDSLPDGYEMLRAGDASLTRRAKDLAKSREETIYVVQEKVQGYLKVIGCRLPAKTLADARVGKKPKQAKVDPEEVQKRKASVQKAAKTRKLNQAAKSDPYAVLLRAVRKAQSHSEQAKSRPSNARTFGDYRGSNRSKHAYHAYRGSRDARQRDYSEKASALDEAAVAAQECGVNAGWQPNSDKDSPVPYIVYFDLPTGQVSFHTTSDCGLPRYDGEWDQETEVAQARIEAAIDEYLAK